MTEPNILSVGHYKFEPRPVGVLLDGNITTLGTPAEHSLGGITTIAETTTLPADFYARFSPDTRVERHAVAGDISARLRTLLGETGVVVNFENGIMDNDMGALALEAAETRSTQGDELLARLAELSLNDVVVANQLVSCLSTPSVPSFLELLKTRKQTNSIQEIALGSVANLPEATARAQLQQIFDAADGAVMRAHSRQAVVIDPSYLVDPAYALLQRVPFKDRPDTQKFVTHTAAGFYWTGSDHTFLYRNRGEIAKAAARGMDDYSVVRPGNYLYHDLVLVENKRGEDEFPASLIVDYCLAHYFQGLYAVAEPDELPPEQHAGTLTYTYDDNERVGIHLRRPPNHAVIPFRALRKSETSSTFYEYGTEAYLAELVDIAGKIDQIDYQQGKNPDLTAELQLGKHLAALPSKIRAYSGNADLATSTWRIILESRGLSSEDASKAACHMAARMTTDQLNTFIKGQPKSHDPWPALTISYEWFTRYAREVPAEEMRLRGCYDPFLHALTYQK
jgi:hypothetical protein